MKKETKIFTIFGSIILAIIIIAAFSLRGINEFSTNSKNMAHTHEVTEILSHNLSIMQDIETGMRGYVITGKANYLEPYNSAIAKLQANLVQLRILTHDNPVQHSRIDSLEDISKHIIDIAHKNISIRQLGGFEEARKRISTEQGKNLMDATRAIHFRMQQEEVRLLGYRIDATVHSLENAKVFIVVACLFSLLVVIILMFVTRQSSRLENELTKSKEHAEQLVGFKNQFLSNMSHEIRTPMNAIIGFTKVVLKTELTAKQKEYLTAIKMSGDALIVLINDILDLAKVDAGKMIFEQTPFRMQLSIAAMLHLFETKIQEKNLRLVKVYDPNIPEVLVGDPVRLHQIILNLVSNAVKFTSKGTITVSVRLVNQDDEKVTIEFAVSDTGIGIKEDKMDSIFENFQQATSGTSRLYGGTGLGLAIVKQLVEPQGGTIEVKSKINEGSTFSFTLSFMKTIAQAEDEEEIVELDTTIKNIRVLVVEDIALNQLLMKTILDDFGFERDIADNGRIAIEKLREKEYDIILMDLQMPEMNGFEATEYIRKSMKSNIPIIALTADVTTVDLAKCKAVGMNDYIAKPVDERVLYSKMVGLVKKPMPIGGHSENGKVQHDKLRCVDLDYLIHRTKSNPVLMMQMISLYLEQTPALISAMKQGLHDKDWNTLYSAVHKMIPSFSIMGISIDFENMAKQVQEYAATQQQTEGIPDLVLQLEKVCTQACIELEEEFNTIKNTSV
jgi:signal transduction histidine kinase/CheY-like chemotaxis protein